jgi:hypothetical protein
MSIGFLLVLIVALVFAGIQIDYRYYLKTLDVTRTTIVESAIRGLQVLQSIDCKEKHIAVIKGIISSLATSCGLVMREVAMGLTVTIQMIVYLVILIYLNPTITLIIIIFGIFAGMAMLQSMSTLTNNVSNRKQYLREAKEEILHLSIGFKKNQIKNGELRNHLKKLYDNGGIGRAMDMRLGIRRETRRGPLSVEYLLPAAIIIIPMISYASGNLKEQAPQLVAYLFVLKNFISALKGFTSTLISTGKYYPDIMCYQKLMTGEDIPECLIQNNQAPDDEDE